MLPSEHPDIEATRQAVLDEVKLSGILTSNGWLGEQFEEEQDEEEPESDPVPTTLQQAIAHGAHLQFRTH